MRLIDIKACSLVEPCIVRLVEEADVRRAAGVKPGYAILSHRWEWEEVTFKDLEKDTWTTKQGAGKLLNAIRIARCDGHAYLWVDTCCIDKDSSSELSEAINSMFRWYAGSTVCYAYLNDFTADAEARRAGESKFNEEFSQSAWFTRGWTLQELLAPADVHFYSSSWWHFGTKRDLAGIVAIITKVPIEVLCMPSSIWSYSVATRMSWASERVTDRPEDIAYSLMGLFEVHMPLLYGEGLFLAFQRLQEEILKRSDDHSLFAWRKRSSEMAAFANIHHGLLADHPFDFVDSGGIRPYHEWRKKSPWSMTNKGLQIELGFLHNPWGIEAVLLCAPNDRNSGFITLAVDNASTVSGQYYRSRIDAFNMTAAEEGDLQQVYFPRNDYHQSMTNTTRLWPTHHVVFMLWKECEDDGFRPVAAICRSGNLSHATGRAAIGPTWTTLPYGDILVEAGSRQRRYITIPKWQPGLHIAILFELVRPATDGGGIFHFVLLIGLTRDGRLGSSLVDYRVQMGSYSTQDLRLRERTDYGSGVPLHERERWRPIDFSSSFRPSVIGEDRYLEDVRGNMDSSRPLSIEASLTYMNDEHGTSDCDLVQVQFTAYHNFASLLKASLYGNRHTFG